MKNFMIRFHWVISLVLMMVLGPMFFVMGLEWFALTSYLGSIVTMILALVLALTTNPSDNMVIDTQQLYRIRRIIRRIRTHYEDTAPDSERLTSVTYLHAVELEKELNRF